MDIQTAEEFRTTKFFCKTSFDMAQIKAEEADYRNYPIPKFYHFDSEDAKERILYANFERIDNEVKDMIKAVFKEFGKGDPTKMHKKSNKASSNG